MDPKEIARLLQARVITTEKAREMLGLLELHQGVTTGPDFYKKALSYTPTPEQEQFMSGFGEALKLKAGGWELRWASSPLWAQMEKEWKQEQRRYGKRGKMTLKKLEPDPARPVSAWLVECPHGSARVEVSDLVRRHAKFDVVKEALEQAAARIQAGAGCTCTLEMESYGPATVRPARTLNDPFMEAGTVGVDNRTPKQPKEYIDLGSAPGDWQVAACCLAWAYDGREGDCPHSD